MRTCSIYTDWTKQLIIIITTVSISLWVPLWSPYDKRCQQHQNFPSTNKSLLQFYKFTNENHTIKPAASKLPKCNLSTQVLCIFIFYPIPLFDLKGSHPVEQGLKVCACNWVYVHPFLRALSCTAFPVIHSGIPTLCWYIYVTLMT